MNYYLERKIFHLRSLGSYSDQNSEIPSKDEKGLLKLDSNENLQLPKSFIKKILGDAAESTDPRVYADGQREELIQLLGHHFNVDPDTLVIASGGDELIQGITSSLMTSNDTGVTIEPTYSMYRYLLKSFGRKRRMIRLSEDFSLDMESVRENLAGTDEVVFICSPNNPTGNQFPRDSIRELLESTKGFVVLDEAYADYAPESLVAMVNDYDNLLVLRTFSKAFGIAGMRIGFAITNSALAESIQKFAILPYPVSSYSMAVGSLILKNLDVVRRTISQVSETREKFVQELMQVRDVVVYPSVTNFVLIEIPELSSTFAYKMKQQGIKIRIVDWIANERNFVRITIPPIDQLKRVVRVFKEVLAQ
ncbi:MAG: histidinol-phosphate aminotransferase family protein [Candidatus Thorarchaeota archaeon]|nr:histidinol-phosphate aminotransferase family protein [Candidatus Thorarchaeota archaeon]